MISLDNDAENTQAYAKFGLKHITEMKRGAS